ncbi:MAG: hypothetical protein AAFQ42_03415 [Pseudomonadota bacterium]
MATAGVGLALATVPITAAANTAPCALEIDQGENVVNVRVLLGAQTAGDIGRTAQYALAISRTQSGNTTQSSSSGSHVLTGNETLVAQNQVSEGGTLNVTLTVRVDGGAEQTCSSRVR